jgi:hypothetical protein
MYERRGDELYPSVFNDVDDYGVPAFEIRGDEAYPTVFNNRHSYGMPAFELRDGEWIPTVYNDIDDYGQPAFEATGSEVSPRIYNADLDPDDSDSSSADSGRDDAAEALGAAAFVATGIGLVAWNALKRRQERREPDSRRRSQPSQPWHPQPASAAPAGWYSADGVQRYWDGQQWTSLNAEPAGSPSTAWSSTASAESGWYPLPVGSRYWDGQRWTEHYIPDEASTYPAAAPSSYPYAPYAIGPQWNTVPNNRGLVITAWVLTFFTAGYMLPWAVAASRRRADAGQIGLLNAFLGWTIVGWFVALAKSLR